MMLQNLPPEEGPRLNFKGFLITGSRCCFFILNIMCCINFCFLYMHCKNTNVGASLTRQNEGLCIVVKTIFCPFRFVSVYTYFGSRSMLHYHLKNVLFWFFIVVFVQTRYMLFIFRCTRKKKVVFTLLKTSRKCRAFLILSLCMFLNLQQMPHYCLTGCYFVFCFMLYL